MAKCDYCARDYPETELYEVETDPHLGPVWLICTSCKTLCWTEVIFDETGPTVRFRREMEQRFAWNREQGL